MCKFMSWVFWTVYYLCQPTPKSFGRYLLRGMRTRWPWRKFRPSVYRNDVGKEWHIYLTEEQSFTERRSIPVDCHVGMESGNIVGFDVWDETIREKKAAKAGGNQHVP